MAHDAANDVAMMANGRARSPMKPLIRSRQVAGGWMGVSPSSLCPRVCVDHSLQVLDLAFLLDALFESGIPGCGAGYRTQRSPAKGREQSGAVGRKADVELALNGVFAAGQRMSVSGA